MFDRLCGDDACKSVILGTTKWGKFENYEMAKTKEQDLRDGFWKHMVAKGSAVYRVDDEKTRTSPWDLVETVLLRGESPIIL